jgi:hypothetical protein
MFRLLSTECRWRRAKGPFLARRHPSSFCRPRNKPTAEAAALTCGARKQLRWSLETAMQRLAILEQQLAALPPDNATTAASYQDWVTVMDAEDAFPAARGGA